MKPIACIADEVSRRLGNMGRISDIRSDAGGEDQTELPTPAPSIQ